MKKVKWRMIFSPYKWGLIMLLKIIIDVKIKIVVNLVVKVVV